MIKGELGNVTEETVGYTTKAECARPRAQQRECKSALENLVASGPSGLAAPEDGRTPLSSILRPWQ